MTDTLPPTPALRRQDMESSMFTKLSEFQQSAAHLKPVAPQLVAVLAAALPAFELGFSYTASHWNGELTVTLHYQGAELGSSAVASFANYGDTCAALLAGLLGIPLIDTSGACEPEQEPLEPASNEEVEQATAAHEAEPAAAVEAVEEEADEEFDDGLDGSPSQPTTPDTQRELTEEEKATAISMIKVMEPAQRKAFTKAFRDLFAVPSDAKQITPHITRLEHWLFIDRYSVEAAGGIAA